MLRDGNGKSTVIVYAHPSQPNIGLGFLLCPDGNQLPQLKSLKTAIESICRKIENAYLSKSETRLAITQLLIPKLTYVLHLTSFTHPQCTQLNSIICDTFLPCLRLNRHYPRAVLHAPPIQFGGMEFPHIHTLQLSTQLEYIIKQLWWNRTIANNFLVTLDSLQLYTGVGSPLLQRTTPPIVYAGHSFILNLQDQLAYINTSLWIEDAWQHPLQREHDEFIMDCFILIPRLTRSQLQQANAVRLYLRVLTIADLADPTGQFIPDGNMSGNWQGGSDIHWPYQPKPPKRFWATFQRCIGLTFCSSTSPHQPAHYGMDLDTPLGKWFPVPRHSWFDVYRSPTHFYWKTEDTIKILRSTPVPGFHVIDGTVTSLPWDSRPVRFQNIGDVIWSHRHYSMVHHNSPKSLPAGITLRNTITTKRQHLKVGCNASLHQHERVATCAWVIETPDSTQIQPTSISNTYPPSLHIEVNSRVFTDHSYIYVTLASSPQPFSNGVITRWLSTKPQTH